MDKRASTDHPVHDLIAARWSPYGFSDRPVEESDLLALFEAARWAPSSYNEQPWRYLVATRDHPEAYEKLISCLVEGNREWAGTAPVLAVGYGAEDLEALPESIRQADLAPRARKPLGEVMFRGEWGVSQ